jgi:CRP-like cAMP-binding protein
LPYYYLQAETLWQPILWSFAFMAVNAVRIVARWDDCSPGEVILKKGQPVCDAIVLISGEMEAVLGSKTTMALRPGQLIGDGSAYSGLASPVDIVARSRGTLAKWDLRQLTEFTASRPALRAKLLNIVSADLAAKLTAAVSGLAAENIAPGLPQGGA